MDDLRIIELYNSRDESAIAQTAAKYGAYLNTIAYNILQDSMDSEECVSDTYLRAWNAIPPAVPRVLRTFIGRITRNLALDMYSARTAQKRGGGEVDACLDELAECLIDEAGKDDAIAYIECRELASLLNDFLGTLPKQSRQMFVRRYYFLDSICEVAKRYACSESNVKTTLFRVRNELRERLKQEGYEL